MAKHPFLTPQWVQEAKRLHGQYKDGISPSVAPVKVDLIVTDVPFDQDTVRARLETGPGIFDVELGTSETPDATVTLQYDVAYAIFIEGNPQVGMQAFMSGKIRVDGDVGKLITVFGGLGGSDPLSGDIGDKLRSITAPHEPT